MEVQLLIGLMGTLCVIAVYFWAVRSRSDKQAEAE